MNLVKSKVSHTEKQELFSQTQFLSDDESEKNPVLLFSEEDFLLDIQDIKIGPQIGEGQFSTVYFGIYFGDPVAVKKQTRKGKDLERYLIRELGALKNLRHANLVEFYGACNVREGSTKDKQKNTRRRFQRQEVEEEEEVEVEEKDTVFAYDDDENNQEQEQELEKEGRLGGNCTLSLLEMANSPFTDYSVYMVSAFAAGGDLLSLLLKEKEIPLLGWKFRLRICMDAICGMKYLHEKGLIHRDIKSSNFLLDKHFRCILSDFGMVRSSPNNINAAKMNRMTICGTDEYMAPELMLDEDYSTPADIFSLGIVLFEIMARQQSGKGGFIHRSPQNLFAIDTDAVKNDLPEDTPESLRLLACQCVDLEAENRPTTEEVFDWIEDLYRSQKEDDSTIPQPPLPTWPGIANTFLGTTNSTINPASEKERVNKRKTQNQSQNQNQNKNHETEEEEEEKGQEEGEREGEGEEAETSPLSISSSLFSSLVSFSSSSSVKKITSVLSDSDSEQNEKGRKRLYSQEQQEDTQLNLSSSSTSPVLTISNISSQIPSQKIVSSIPMEITHNRRSSYTTQYQVNNTAEDFFATLDPTLLHIATSDPPSYKGWVHKRKVSGFRFWHKRWVEVEGDLLCSYEKPGGIRYGHEISLIDQTLEIKEKDFKWKLKSKRHPGEAPREFAASTKEEMYRFCGAIQRGMKYAVARKYMLAQSTRHRRTSSTFDSIFPSMKMNSSKLMSATDKNETNESDTEGDEQDDNDSKFNVANQKISKTKNQKERMELKCEPFLKSNNSMLSFTVRKSKLKILLSSSSSNIPPHGEFQSRSYIHPSNQVTTQSTRSFTNSVSEYISGGSGGSGNNGNGYDIATAENKKWKLNSPLQEYKLLVMYRVQASFTSDNGLINKAVLVYLLQEDLLHFHHQIKKILQTMSSYSKQKIICLELPSLPDVEIVSTLEPSQTATANITRINLEDGKPSSSSPLLSSDPENRERDALLNQFDTQLGLAEKESSLQNYLNSVVGLLSKDPDQDAYNNAILRIIGKTFQL